MAMDDETKAMYQEAAVTYSYSYFFALAWSNPQTYKEKKLNRDSISRSKLLSVSELYLLTLQKIARLCSK
jgi:hypothetical protein